MDALENPRSLVVAIDGPSGSGKSTVAESVANKLGYIYVNTGALYRALAVYFHQLHIAADDVEGIKKMLPSITLDYPGKVNHLVLINGVNLTEEITKHYASDLSSKVSAIPIVRDFLLAFQRELAEKKFCVMEGRDIGTVVFPRSFCKIFLTASLDVRSKRRFEQLRSKVDLATVKKDLAERDERDKNRSVAPLKQADDAYYLDSSEKNIEQVVEEICNVAKLKKEEFQLEDTH